MSKHLGGAGAVDVWIVTVCLNDVVGLSRTLWSIEGQQGVRLGVIIADGGSDDGSLQMARAFAHSRTDTVVLPGPDRGIYHGMNRGLAAVPGDAFVWFLNAGDFFTDGEAAARSLSSMTSESVWLGGPMVAVRPSGALDGVTAVPCVESSARPVLPAQPSMITRKSAITRLGGFRENLRLAADGLLVQQLAETHRLTVYPEPAVYFGLGGRSSSNIALTLRELRAGDSTRAGTSAKPLRERLIIAKTRLRHAQYAMELKLPISSVGRLDRWRSTRCDHAAHWPHPQVKPGSIECCYESAARFYDNLNGHRSSDQVQIFAPGDVR